MASAAAAQPVDRVEVIPFHSTSPTSKQFLTGDQNAKPALIAGELRLPRPGPEKRRSDGVREAVAPYRLVNVDVDGDGDVDEHGPRP